MIVAMNQDECLRRLFVTFPTDAVNFLGALFLAASDSNHHPRESRAVETIITVPAHMTIFPSVIGQAQ